MDIDDILREADPDYYSKPGDDGDLEALTRAWVAERSAPELLDWPANGLIERANEKIQRQIEKVEVMTGDMDPKTNFGLIVIQTELERWKYLVRGFLRARLSKIDKHTLHYLSTPSLRSRLSPSEISFATRHQALLHEHYLSSFLQSFPPQLRNLDDTAGGISMVDAPELDTAVFIRALKDCIVEIQGGNAEDMVDALAGEVLIARLKEGEEAYNKCRSRFFMDAMKLVSDRVASGDPTAKSLEADYATLVETRASQNRHSKVKKTRTNNETQATEDLESKFQVLADAAGTLPGQPGYKRLLRKFLTGEHAANAEKYYSNARNVNDKNKLFRFEALALVCGLEYDTPIYNKVYSDFFQKKGTLLASALQSANGYEPSSTAIMEHETKTFPSATASPQKSSDESTTMRSLRNKLAAARINGAPSEPVSQMPEPETRFQRLVLSLGLIEGSNGYKRHRCQFFYYESFRDEVLKSRDDIAVEKLGRFEECCATRGLQQGTNEFRIFKRHFDIENEDDNNASSEGSFSMCGFSSADDDSHRSQNVAQNHGTQNYRAQSKGAQHNGSHKPHAQQGRTRDNGPQNDGPQKSRAQKAKEDFNAYFGNPGKLENWQRLCRDLGIEPIPTSITNCKKESNF
ncbi:hypothetical protein V491_01746 [Pseudogymnoascus sp. VKM F-3775]|nr:hypothetical protein V491_01746 [Pseudogymnoascus sp. VKM F-3775]